jgi:hypothetical protein
VIRALLRRPARPVDWVADGVRLLGVLSVVAGFLWWSPTDAGILALALPALLLPRLVGARATFDIAFGLVVLAAAWSNVLDLYTTVPGWDLVMHFACTGVVAAMLYLLLARLSVVPLPLSSGTRRRTPVAVVTALGLAVSALWEMIEWAGKTFISDEIFVSYDDTIGDMAIGGVGAVMAGLVVARVRLLREE